MFTTSQQGGAHILVFPFSSSGHVIPLLDLTRSLLNRGLVITVVITTDNLPLLNPLLSSHSPTQLHHLVLPSPDIDDASSTTHPLIAKLRSMHAHYPFLLNWFKSHASPPLAIISDFFLGWTHHLASQLGLPRVVFSPSGASAFSVLTSIWHDQPQNENGNLDFVVSFPKIPNSPSYPWWQIFHIYRMSKDSDWEFFRDSYLANIASWGIIFNSFTELEGVYIDHVKKEFGNDRVWAVGPALPSNDDLMGPVANRGGTSSVPCHDVLTWLDSREDLSVVYVAFGSWTVLTSKQMEVLVAGLEKSGVSFILCARQAGDHSVLLDGFEDRTAGRGFIVKGWAPQVAILRHRAVGAFLTHCGWNSVLEGISAGVVMLTWPMSADQFTNAQLLADELKVGIRVGEATQKIPDSDELARILAESVKKNLPERVKAKELQEAALNAVKGGSSDADLDGLVSRLNELKT
ncbi:flavonol 3-O-glucosyltransferase UGT89B1 [Ricinus communis]|uniref:UDP-glucosyltransferase, putative n=1 Tax=Ricinus communis TaxID=3988 RepID=B9RLH5_RICCO|nr:flavonol 3-O-glucosyltransferase UGT89B1 [Ricinus communis]EEF47700.1 UDP-glucosyltransferase, putative [Ricinus communis]|eukprot:XP_002514594.1 UDP-glycosyltransferase 89B1 [Ricinus communis]